MTDPGYFPRNYDDVPEGAAVDVTPVPVPGVASQFQSLRRRGDYLGIRDGGGFPKDRYTGEGAGQGSSECHIQGIVRLRTGHRFLLSGGDPLEDVSHLFLAETPSLDPLRPLGSNVRDARVPPDSDRITAMYGLQSRWWHAGGIGLLGNIVSVPFQGMHPGQADPKAVIGFYDFTDPLSPRKFASSNWIVCETSSVGASALTRLPGGGLLLAVWRDAIKASGERTGRFDFYVSTVADWPKFAEKLSTVVYVKRLSDAEDNPRYQGLGFVVEASTGEVFLIGTANTSEGAPEFGTDYADLYRLSLPPELSVTPAQPAPGGSRIALQHVNHLRLDAADDWCDFAAGGGVSVSPEGLLCLYGIHHFRFNGLFRATEFRADPPALPSAVYAWVDLFEHREYAGRRLSILGDVDTAIPDYGRVGAQGRAFADAASSIRYQLPTGWVYRCFRDTDYAGSNGLDLTGDGTIREIPDLKAVTPGFNDCISSSKRIG